MRDVAEHLKTTFHLPEADCELFIQHLRLRSFKKGEVLVAPGQIQKDLYLITQGVQMSYFESDEKLHVIAFTYPPGFCAIPESFCFQKPSAYYLKALTETEALAISHLALEKTFDQSQNIERLFRKTTERILSGLISRHIDLHTLSIEQRFKTFCQRSAHLLQTVPHKYIASYLGIDSTNFSKLYNSVRF
jgi:CRP-like cAMP-binding protein